MNLVSVREHARIAAGPLAAESLDSATIPHSAFDWLCRESARLRKNGAVLVQHEERHALRLDNYVGVLETPCGTRIEILPKHVDGEAGAATARGALVSMLRHCLNLPTRDTRPTALHTFDRPVSEWIIGEFLSALDALVRRGPRFDYKAVEEEARFLRGRLRVAAQIRQPPGRQHLFQVEHQVFDSDCAENRLLVSTLAKAAGLTRDPGNWRRAHELQHQLAEIPRSQDIGGDFRRWRDDRLMARYRELRPWCELILQDRDPSSVLGDWTGRSLLFPMEKVFETYVGVCLQRTLPVGIQIGKPRSEYLCRQGERPAFQLKPDFLIRHGDSAGVVDAKWKRLDSSAAQDKNYGLGQGDLYQLHAYGHHYAKGCGQLVLVFPRTDSFTAPLEPFVFQGGRRLHVIPLDVTSGTFVTDVSGQVPWVS